VHEDREAHRRASARRRQRTDDVKMLARRHAAPAVGSARSDAPSSMRRQRKKPYRSTARWSARKSFVFAQLASSARTRAASAPRLSSPPPSARYASSSARSSRQNPSPSQVRTGSAKPRFGAESTESGSLALSACRSTYLPTSPRSLIQGGSES